MEIVLRHFYRNSVPDPLVGTKNWNLGPRLYGWRQRRRRGDKRKRRRADTYTMTADTLDMVRYPEDTDLKLRGSVQNKENYKEKVHERHLFLMTRTKFSKWNHESP